LIEAAADRDRLVHQVDELEKLSQRRYEELVETRIDRGFYKVRAGAMERAIREVYVNYQTIECNTCIHYGKKHPCINCSEKRELWEFATGNFSSEDGEKTYEKE